MCKCGHWDGQHFDEVKACDSCECAAFRQEKPATYAIGARFRSRKTMNELEVVDLDFRENGELLMKVSVEGGSPQLMEAEQLEKNWVPAP